MFITDNRTKALINKHYLNKNIEIEVRFNISQYNFYRVINNISTELSIEVKKENYIDWIEYSTSLRRRFYAESSKAEYKIKKQIYHMKDRKYNFTLSISEELDTNTRILKPDMSKVNETYSFKYNDIMYYLSRRTVRRLISDQLSGQIDRTHQSIKESHIYTLEIELIPDTKSNRPNPLDILNKNIYIALKMIQGYPDFINFEYDKEKLVYTEQERTTIIELIKERNILFPRPIELTFDKLTSKVMLSPKFGYRVTLKADGVRKFLIFHNGIWLLDLASNLQLVTREYDKTFDGVIIEGESIDSNEIRLISEINKDIKSKYYFIAFDALSKISIGQDLYRNNQLIPDFSIMQESHQVRMNQCQIISDYAKDDLVGRLYILTKDFYSFNTAEEFFERVRTLLARIPYVPYRTDGLVFVPNNLSYQDQVDKIYKWKPIDRMSIDLKYSRGLLYDNKNNIVNIPFEIKIPVEEGNIIEFAFRKKDGTGYFTSVRVRYDRENPNNPSTIERTLKILRNPIPEEVIKGDIRNDIIFLRKYHNRVKKRLLMKSETRLNDYNITDITLLDVGSGKGQDVSKWSSIASLRKVYAIEPNSENVKELERRIKESAIKEKVKVINKKIKNSKSYIKNTRIDICSLFNVLTLLDDEDLEVLIHILKSNVAYRGEINFLVLDGKIVKSVFTNDDKNHGASFSISGDISMKLENGKVYTDIKGTIVKNYEENLFFVDKFVERLSPEFTMIRFGITNKETFMTHPEHVLSSMYSYGTFVRMDDDKEDIIKIGRKKARRIYCIIDFDFPELHPILKKCSEEYRKISSGSFNRYAMGLKFKKNSLQDLSKMFNVDIILLDENFKEKEKIEANPPRKQKVFVYKNFLIEI
jgi:FkbM family methyltransferase